jgi:hypothetical protein
MIGSAAWVESLRLEKRGGGGGRVLSPWKTYSCLLFDRYRPLIIFGIAADFWRILGLTSTFRCFKGSLVDLSAWEEQSLVRVDERILFNGNRDCAGEHSESDSMECWQIEIEILFCPISGIH